MLVAIGCSNQVVLRWWTPRGAEGGAGGCSGPLWRVTPADVASRPSACLVNFLLNGRSVTLEMPRYEVNLFIINRAIFFLFIYLRDDNFTLVT